MANQLLKNMKINAHKKSMKSCKNNSLLHRFVTPEHELDKISSADCALVFHGVKHGHSYRSSQSRAMYLVPTLQIESLMMCFKLDFSH